MAATTAKTSGGRKILEAVGEFLFLSFLSLLVPVIVATDIRYFVIGFSEIPLTELSQEVLLGISAALFVRRAVQSPGARGFLTLVAGMFFTMLIREFDAYLDRWVYHSFWVWPASATVISFVGYAALRCRDTVWGPMADFVNSRSHYCIMLGLVILLVFSRSFGSGDLLWKHVMGTELYSLTFKTALQEGLELFGYMLICYGALRFEPAGTAGRSETNTLTADQNPSFAES